MKINSLKEAEDFLMSRLPVFQNEGKKAYKPGLERINKLLASLGNPHDHVKCIHVAGTNGKGTTSNFLATCLQEAGYKVGLFTSPHFLNFTERIKVNGTNIDETFVCQFLENIHWETETTSYFELLTALGFAYFNDKKVDVAVIEVGLGGRLDSTNVCKPILSTITNLALDHCDVLGYDIDAIAIEKAGIKKEGTPLVVAPIPESCKTAITNRYGTTEITFLDGNPEVNNNKTLVKHLLPYLHKHFSKLKTINADECFDKMHSVTGFQGRYQKLSNQGQNFVLDVAHNAPALQQLFAKVAAEYGDNVAYVIGFSSDKDLEPLKSFVPKSATYYPVQASVLRAKPYSDTFNFFEALELKTLGFNGKKYVGEVVSQIIDNQIFETVVVCGSFFVVSDALKFFQEKNENDL